MSNQLPPTPPTNAPLITTDASSDAALGNHSRPRSTETESYFYPWRPSHSLPRSVLTRPSHFSSPNPPTPGLLESPPIDIVTRPSLIRSTTAESSSSFLRNVQQTKHGHMGEQSASPSISPTFESPLQSSSASVFSSTGMSSGDYLTPPAAQRDFDLPPYRASRRDSKSLTMKDSSGKKGKSRKSKRRSPRPSRRGQAQRSTSFTFYEHRQNAYWWIPGCQMAPTAPSKLRNFCEGDTGNRLVEGCRAMLKGSNESPQKSASTLKRIITRRWSSVEIGAHHSRPAVPVASFSFNDTSRSLKPSDISPPALSSDRDLVDSIRRTLTTRHVPRVDLPSSITLRRPSAITRMVNPNLVKGSGTESANPRSPALVEETETPTAYLITNQDIDCITALINASLRRGISSEDTVLPAKKPSLAPPSILLKRPSITSYGLIPQSGSPAHATVTTDGVQSPYTLARDASAHLHVGISSTHGKERAISHTPSTRSLHEILWDDVLTRSSTTSPMSNDMSDGRVSNQPSPAETPFFTPRRGSNASNSEPLSNIDRPHSSLKKWKWACPDPPVSTPHIRSSTGNSEYFGTCDGLTKPRDHKKLRIGSPKSDVISFPPLNERRATSEWITPLPDITQPEPNELTLHDVGIDATYGGESTPRIPLQAPTPKSSRQRRSVSNFDQEPQQTIRLRTSIFSSDQDLHRRSVLHPHASARTGATLTSGSSIGASLGSRRKSSMPHIRIPDHFGVDKPGSTWRKAREDSCYPTVLEPVSPDDDSQHSHFEHTGKNFHTHREKMLKEKTPLLPGTIDRVGIYNKITGSTSEKRPSLMPGGKHHCHECSTDSESRMPSVDWIG